MIVARSYRINGINSWQQALSDGQSQTYPWSPIKPHQQAAKVLV